MSRRAMLLGFTLGAAVWVTIIVGVRRMMGSAP